MRSCVNEHAIDDDTIGKAMKGVREVLGRFNQWNWTFGAFLKEEEQAKH